MNLYECSGLIVASTLPLSAPTSKSAKTPEIDVTVVLGDEVDQPFLRPSTDLIAELVIENYVAYTICRVGDTYVVRLPHIADFVIDADLRHVICHPVPSGRTEMIPIIVTGTITAFVLAMGGQLVLHGSTVELAGTGIAFVGASGQGKSTMAAIFCAAGASLVTDDILPLTFDSDGALGEAVFCVRSGHEIRLREKAASLTKYFPVDGVRITQDERHAVTPRATPLERIPLSAILLPRPDRRRSDVIARRLGPGEASLALGRCERIEGWRDNGHLRQQFEDVGRIVTSVPVFEVSVPWGPPFAADLANRILDACGLDSPLVHVSGVV